VEVPVEEEADEVPVAAGGMLAILFFFDLV
jgi:hypothetical protein